MQLILEKSSEITMKLFSVTRQDPCVAPNFDLKFPFFLDMFFSLVKLLATFSESHKIKKVPIRGCKAAETLTHCWWEWKMV